MLTLIGSAIIAIYLFCGGVNCKNLDGKQPGQLAMEKCHEYSKYVYTEQAGFSLLMRSQKHNITECKIEAVPLVVGGEKAHDHEFPHMVAIGYGKTRETAEWMCGGSLISDMYVLSAAHCSKSREKGPALFARIGVTDISSSEEGHDYFITQRINHPDYKPPSRYHDIALFKINGPAKMNAYLRPACLHTAHDETSLKKFIATGWGKMKYTDIKGSSDLMKVSLDVIDYDNCNKTFVAEIGGRLMRNGVITEQLCAGVMAGGKDTCQGDSGGPLQVVMNNPHCMYDIIGITSMGKFCGFKESPAVYTRVSHYIEWIESVVWGS